MKENEKLPKFAGLCSLNGLCNSVSKLEAGVEAFRLSGGTQFTFEHCDESILPTFFLSRHGFLRIESFLQAKPGLRFAEAQNTRPVRELKQKQVDVALHEQRLALKAELCQQLIERHRGRILAVLSCLRRICSGNRRNFCKKRVESTKCLVHPNR